MKILKIKNKKGYYFNKNEEYIAIDIITKEDIYHLIQLCIEKEVEIDEYEDELLDKPNEKIIYKNLSTKLSDVIVQRETILINKNKLYEEAVNKYKHE